MKKQRVLLTFLFTLFTALIFCITAASESIKCDQCSQSDPCVTVLEFKDVKFAHDVYCWVDTDGSEHWDSEDGSKLELFYYFNGNKKGTDEMNDIEI